MRPHFRRFNVSPRRMACDKINADGSEEDTESFAEGERFVQENQSEHGSANDKHAIDRDDDAGWPFGQREEIKDNRNHQGHAGPEHMPSALARLSRQNVFMSPRRMVMVVEVATTIAEEIIRTK